MSCQSRSRITKTRKTRENRSLRRKGKRDTEAIRIQMTEMDDEVAAKEEDPPEREEEDG